MEYLLYFSQNRVTLDDIAQVAGERGYLLRIVDSSPDDVELIVYPKDLHHTTRWVWSEWSPSRVSSFQLTVCATYAPAVAFRIGTLSTTDTRLADLLKTIMHRFGGWVGRDGDLVLSYDKGNIECLCRQAEDDAGVDPLDQAPDSLTSST